MNQIDLRGRVAIVTGGASGIGRATVERLTQSGAVVTVFDIAEACPSSAAFGAIDRRHLDVTNEDAVSAGVDWVLSKHRAVDILVNCAGIAGTQVSVADCSLEAWRRVLEVNLTGTFLCCRAAARVMRPTKGGRIINVASAAGKDANPYSAHYSASKAAVIALTQALGRELARSSIRVNCVTPGAVNTPLLAGIEPDRRSAAIAKIPIGRLAETKEVAAMIAWLASEECSFSTGAVFDLSGGRSTY